VCLPVSVCLSVSVHLPVSVSLSHVPGLDVLKSQRPSAFTYYYYYFYLFTLFTCLFSKVCVLVLLLDKVLGEYFRGKRDLLQRQKRPTIEAKETYYRGKRDLL